jgi:subtilisin family serine protease
MMPKRLPRTWRRLALLAVVALVAAISWVPSPLEARQSGPNRTTWLDAFAHSPTSSFQSAQAQAIARATAQGLDYVPGEVIFRFKNNTPTFLQERALTAIRSRPQLTDVHWMRDIGLIHDDTQPDANVLAQQLREQSEVEFAQPNYLRHPTPVTRVARAAVSNVPPTSGGLVRHLSAAGAAVPAFTPFEPNDPDYSSTQWNFPLIGMPGAWGINPGGSSSIIVAVVDTGITMTSQTLTTPLWNGSAFVSSALLFAKSPDLSASRLVNPQDLVFTTNNDVLDLDGHATHVASTIGEDTNNGLALAGIAFNARIMPIKVCTGYWEAMILQGRAGIPGFATGLAGGSTCTDSAIIQGIQDAVAAGAKVINLSLGGTEPDTGLQFAIQEAVADGAFVAIAMGNDFANGNPTEYPAFYAAGIDGAMSVAAVTSSMAHASYSSSGSYCEIAAPGGDGPDGLVTSFIWQVTLNFSDQDPSLVLPRFDRYDEIGYTGTSMATAHVSGVAALIMSEYPGITPAAVEALIKHTPTNLGSATEFGSGLIQARAALFGLGIAK